MAMISKNSVIAVCTPFTVVSRSSLMSVIITFMFDPAKLQMNCASASGRISLRADASGIPATLAGAELSLIAALPPRLRARERRVGVLDRRRLVVGEMPGEREPPAQGQLHP